MNDLNPGQIEIAAFLHERLPVGPEIDTLSFSLAGNFNGKFHAAFAEILSDEYREMIVFSIPTYTSHVFLALASVQQNEVARILANVEDYERETGRLVDFGEAVLLPDSTVATSADTVAVLVLRTATARSLSAVPDRHYFGGKEVRFFLLIPLSAAEYRFRSECGHDALLERFAEKSKDISFFGS